MENYFLLLGLPFDPPEEDPARIEAAINQKKSQWTQERSHPGKKGKAMEYLASLNQIRAVMLDPSARAIQAREAAALKKEKLAELEQKLALYRSIGDTLSEPDLKQLLVRFSPFGVTEQEIRTRFQKDKKTGGSSFNLAQVWDWDHARDVKETLAQLEVAGETRGKAALSPTLYNFLELPSTSPASRLLERAAAMKKEVLEKGKKTGADNLVQKLCGICETVFKDQETRRKYDRYVALTKYALINDAADDLARGSQMALTQRMKEGLIDFAVRNCGLSILQASEYISSYCAYMSYSLPGDTVACGQCGAENPLGSANCCQCGGPLLAVCPSCGRRCGVGAKVCSYCGFKMESIGQVEALCAEGERAIDTLDFQTAAARLEDAARLWPRSDKVKALKARLAEARKLAGNEAGRLREAAEARRYQEARQRYDRLRDLFPKYRDPALEQEMSAAISAADALVLQARSAAREEQVLALCAQAAALCADHPGLQPLREAYPPAPPTGFSVTPDPRARGNALSWTPPRSPGPVSFVVVRSAGGRVHSPAGGEELYRGTACSYWDSEIEPGTPYWYNVFALREGVLSQGAAEGGRDVVNLFEIGPVSVTPGDRSLRLSWEAPPRPAAVELYRTGGGREVHLASTREQSFLVTGLTNGVEHSFRVALSYPSGGKKLETPGVTVSAAPLRPPAQAEQLRVSPAGEGRYRALWRHSGPDEVWLFASPQRPRWRTGEVVPLSALERTMTRLQTQPLPPGEPLEQEEQGASFRDPGWEKIYITAAAVRSGAAIFGPLARAGGGAEVVIRDIRTVNGRIHIFLDPPRDAGGFQVLCRFDRPPTDRSDPVAEAYSLTIGEYANHSAILLDAPAERKYYFAVYAWFDEAGEREWSPGAQQVFDCSPKVVITYAVSPARSFLGRSSVTLEFQANTRRFALPETDVLSALRAAPIFRESASLLHTIPAQTVDGTLRVSIPLPRQTPKDTYIRPFFRDESAQAGSQLRLKVGSSHKIT